MPGRLGVYPRTGGGNPYLFAQESATGGLSPHGRGKPVNPQVNAISQGSIPARAGETPGKEARLG